MPSSISLSKALTILCNQLILLERINEEYPIGVGSVMRVHSGGDNNVRGSGWEKPRRVVVLVDNDSWILPYVERLVRELCRDGDAAQLVRHAEDLPEGDVAFLLGCVGIVPTRLLDRSHFNLVVHESPLPKGRGFSPMTWQILEGVTVPIRLSPIPTTSRVLPIPRVKLGLGRAAISPAMSSAS